MVNILSEFAPGSAASICKETSDMYTLRILPIKACSCHSLTTYKYLTSCVSHRSEEPSLLHKCREARDHDPHSSSLSASRISPPNKPSKTSNHHMSFQYKLALFQSNSPVSVRGTWLPIMAPLNHLRNGI